MSIDSAPESRIMDHRRPVQPRQRPLWRAVQCWQRRKTV